MRWLLRPLALAGALIFLFEEWAWAALAGLAAWFAAWPPFRAAERWYCGLPPYATLAVVGLPLVAVEPAKILALYLIAAARPEAGVALLLAAYLIGTAIVARLVRLGRPQLDRIAWVAWGLGTIERFSARVHAFVRETAAYRAVRRMMTRLQAWLGRVLRCRPVKRR